MLLGGGGDRPPVGRQAVPVAGAARWHAQDRLADGQSHLLLDPLVVRDQLVVGHGPGEPVVDPLAIGEVVRCVAGHRGGPEVRETTERQARDPHHVVRRIVEAVLGVLAPPLAAPHRATGDAGQQARRCVQPRIEQHDANAALGQPHGRRRTARTGADDDHLVALGASGHACSIAGSTTPVSARSTSSGNAGAASASMLRARCAARGRPDEHRRDVVRMRPEEAERELVRIESSGACDAPDGRHQLPLRVVGDRRRITVGEAEQPATQHPACPHLEIMLARRVGASRWRPRDRAHRTAPAAREDRRHRSTRRRLRSTRHRRRTAPRPPPTTRSASSSNRSGTTTSGPCSW